MTEDYQLSVVIAEESAAGNLPDILEVIAPDAHPQVEFIFCSNMRPKGIETWLERENVRALTAIGRIPLLWREGIVAASADQIAITTAHCIPAMDWISSLLNICLEEDEAAVGGAIANPDHPGMLSQAIFLLRYFPFRPHGEGGPIEEIAADNALYDRAAIMRHRDLLQSGFWEPSFHRRFHSEGLSLRFNPRVLVFHHNRYTIGHFFRQRLDHGYAFGVERASRMSFGKLLVMTALSPAIPLVFLSKVLIRTLEDRSYVTNALSCLPLLLLFACAWGWGEARGYLSNLVYRLSPVKDADRRGLSHDE